jgi:uncharacterized protein (DUF4415 family)
MKKTSKRVIYTREPGDPISEVARKNIQALLSKPNRKIDTSDIPPLTEEFWRNAVRGRFYRPVKRAVSLRLDADVIAWLKKDGKGYQTRANQVLREKMLKEMAG